MMTRYYLSSAAFHVLLLMAILLSPFFRHPTGPGIMIDGFEFVGGGGGAAGPSGPKKEQMGQVVPQPVKQPVPEKAGPVQKATKAEDAWKVQKAPPKVEKQPEKAAPPIERGEKTQEEKTNIIRRGVAPNTTPGEGGFDFGASEGKAGDQGKGVGIGFGPGEGPGFGGFGSYLRIVRQRIWSEWTQSAVYGSNEVCIIGLTIHRDGDVTDISVEKGSGNGFYDSVALRAVRNASPLPPLPSAFPKDEQRFRIQFRLTE
jgi:protein TonB